MRVFRGPAAGDVFFGNNHGVTRARATNCEATWDANPRHRGYRTCYDDHRHPAWYMNSQTHEWVPDEGACSFNGGSTQCSLMVGYNYALGVANNGDILTANEWKFGITLITPDPTLEQWRQFGEQPWRLEWFVPDLNSMESFDNWRGFTQTKDGLFYLGSKDFGLWQMATTLRSDGIRYQPVFARVADAPSGSISALVGTDDGSLYVGTNGSGLWRMKPDKTFERVSGVSGGTVRELSYDPRTTPSTLYVVTSDGLFVLRGP